MPEHNKKPNKPLPVYILTQTGTGFNDEGIRNVTDFVLGADTSKAGPQGYGIDNDTTGILAFSGTHLLDPETLTSHLEQNPTARVIVSLPFNDGSYTLCAYGPHEKGLRSVIDYLRTNPTPYKDSWNILMYANGYRETED